MLCIHVCMNVYLSNSFSRELIAYSAAVSGMRICTCSIALSLPQKTKIWLQGISKCLGGGVHGLVNAGVQLLWNSLFGYSLPHKKLSFNTNFLLEGHLPIEIRWMHGATVPFAPTFCTSLLLDTLIKRIFSSRKLSLPVLRQCKYRKVKHPFTYNENVGYVKRVLMNIWWHLLGTIIRIF